MAEKFFNVVAVNTRTGEERVVSENKTKRNADAIVDMAVIRRGCDVEFFKTVPLSINPDQRRTEQTPLGSLSGR